MNALQDANMTLLWMPIWVVVGLVVELAIMALLWRPRKGSFRIDRDDARAFTVDTDLGQFTIDRARGRFAARVGGHRREMTFAQIERLDFAYREKWATGVELFGGFGFWDLFQRYRDTIEWYEIAVVSGGVKTPVFVIGQYVPREPWSRWYFELQVRLLTRLGCFRSAEDEARQALDKLQGAFRESGHQMTLRPAWAAAPATTESAAD